MTDTVRVKGLKQLDELLDVFPIKLQRNIMRGALRAGMKVVKPTAQHNIHSVSGELAKGLKISTSINRKGVAMAKLKATGPHAMVAKWVEYGTKSHAIAGFVAFRGVVRHGVQHPGARPKAFMRPALDSQAGAAVVATGNYVKERLTQTRVRFSETGMTISGPLNASAADIDVEEGEA